MRCRGRTGRRPSESRCASRPTRTRAARAGVAGDAFLAHVPARLRRARRQEADEVRHVAAAHQQPAAVVRVADQLGDPAHRLRLDLGRGRRQRPGADIRIDRRGQEVAEDADRRRRRRDVAEEARMPVEQRVLEQQSRRLLEQRGRVRACSGQRTVEIERARAPPTAIRRGSPDRAASIRETPRPDRPADVRARGTSRRPSRAARARGRCRRSLIV